MIRSGRLLAVLLGATALPQGTRAQQIDLSHGGQVTVTALGGFDWNQNAQTVTAYGSAQAVRGGATVTADRLIAYYRKKAPTPAGSVKPNPQALSGALPSVTTGGGTGGAIADATPKAAPGTASAAATASGTTAVNPLAAPPPAGSAAAAIDPTPENPTGLAPLKSAAGSSGLPGGDGSASEIYRLEAIGHVHIFTATQQAFGDHGVYDIDRSVMVLTGHDLRLTTPTDLLTARDQMEYYAQTRVSIGRGNAVVTTNDGRRVRADVLVGYSAPPAPAGPAKPAAKPAPATASGQDPIGSSGKLEKVNAFGHVVVQTQTETVRGDRGVYVPDTGIARIVGDVHITRGENQLNGAAAIVNMHTGLATMTEDPGARVQGLIVPNDAQHGAPAAGAAKDPRSKVGP